MTEDFTSEALSYLLDELDDRRRAAFECMLQNNPAARVELKAQADALAAFAMGAAPARSLAPGAERFALGTILAAASDDRPNRPMPRRWSTYAWPAAAALLLALNLLQLLLPRHPTAPDRVAETREDSVDGGNAATGAKSGSDRTAVDPDGPAENGVVTPSTKPGHAEGDEAPWQRLELLRAEFAQLQNESHALRAEYDGIIRELAQTALIERGLGRIAAMELVDSASYARGERRGLIDLARSLLTEPGIIALDPFTPLVPTPVTPEPGTEGANTVPLPPPPPNPVGGPGTAPDANDPYAWSVFDEVQQQGFLNLYNLPPVSVDQTLQLWVKPAGAQEFQRIGEVPSQFYGGSGSVTYRLPESSAPPAEILVTQEPRDHTGPLPTGPVILRGP